MNLIYKFNDQLIFATILMNLYLHIFAWQSVVLRSFDPKQLLCVPCSVGVNLKTIRQSLFKNSETIRKKNGFYISSETLKEFLRNGLKNVSLSVK